MLDDRSCLVRYGVMSHVGRFSAARVRECALERGQLVVIQTDRGVELGEVLTVLDAQLTSAQDHPRGPVSLASDQDAGVIRSDDSPHVVRVAGPDDLARSRDADEIRPSRFSLCERILREGNWPWPLIDIEPLLDGRMTVLHYLGPRHIDVAPLRARFRVECDFDVILESFGSDPVDEAADGDAHDHGADSGCGSCGCSAGGGCGSASASTVSAGQEAGAAVSGGCSTEPHSGCSSCGISRMKAEWSRARA